MHEQCILMHVVSLYKCEPICVNFAVNFRHAKAVNSRLSLKQLGAKSSEFSSLGGLLLLASARRVSVFEFFLMYNI